MPSNVIIFDAEYIAELTSSMTTACSLVGEAVKSLKKASMHEGWQCKECSSISENLDALNSRLGRLDEGVNETTRILRGSVSRFEELERQYRDQSDDLSRDLQSNYGFTGSGYNGSSSSSGQQFGGTTGTPDGSTLSSPAETPQQNTTPSTSSTDTQNTPSGQNTPQGSSPVQENAGYTERQPGDSNMSGNYSSGNYSNTPYTLGQSSDLSSWQISSTGDIQLPVTHIPYRPDSAVTENRSATEVENATVDSVTASIITVLSTSPGISSMNSAQRNAVISSIQQAYNSGKEVVNNTSAITSEPTRSHAQENIAIASGIVSMVGGLTQALSMLGIPGLDGIMELLPGNLLSGAAAESVSAGAVSAASSGGSVSSVEDPYVSGEYISGDYIAGDVMGGQYDGGSAHFTSAAIATNAETVMQNIGNDSGSQEVREVMQAFSGNGGSGSGSTGNQFLDKIKSSIMEKMQGGISLGFLGSVGIKDFLGKVF